MPPSEVYFLIDKLELLLALAKERHFGRAAANLHLSQQGLSHRIGRLEQDLGIALFVRGSRTVELSRSPSAITFSAATVITIARPGQIAA